MKTGKKTQRRSLPTSTLIETLGMKDLEHSVMEGLTAAFLLARRGYVTPLAKLIAASVDAISRRERLSTLHATLSQHTLNRLKDRYEPEGQLR